AVATLARRQPPYQGATTPDGERAGRGQQPLAGALQPAPFTGAALQVGVLADGCRPYGLAVVGYARRHRPCWLCPLRVAPASLVGWPWLQPAAPLQEALVVPWSWVADNAWGLAVAGHPSSLPSLRKRSMNT
ncbi:hypothetical protein BHE74_00055454, partial [Ensete ventricosum]